MSLTDTIEVLRDTALFRKLDDKRLKVIAMMGETQSFRSGEEIFAQGDEGDAAYIVISGSVDVIVGTDGSATAVTTLGRAEIFGEIAVLCDLRRTTGIRAHEDASVLKLSRTQLLNLMQEFPDIALEMIRILGNRLQATTKDLVAARVRLGEADG